MFTLLESTYSAFDSIAKRRRVFKVETVGDCYVAAAGLPEKRRDHALIMARFAHACLQATSKIMQKLETTLGPDTGDLNIRIGLHSGPVTAGILRGERSRFQLFGDTMNTAARLESTGMPGLIHLSDETANLLAAAGKSHWTKPRSTMVDLKGKGSIQSYWLNVKAEDGCSTESGDSDLTSSHNGGEQSAADAKRDRLIEWHVETFSKLLQQIIARRRATEKARRRRQPSFDGTERTVDPIGEIQTCQELMEKNLTCLDLVKEIIELPKFDKGAAKYQEDPSMIVLDPKVVEELRGFIRTISHLYHNNGFHNFEHASHVTMSVCKLLSRIIMPSDVVYEIDEGTKKNEKKLSGEIASTLHDHTYGITSDPVSNR